MVNDNIVTGPRLVFGDDSNIIAAYALATNSDVIGQGDFVKFVDQAAASGGVVCVERVDAGDAIDGYVVAPNVDSLKFTDTDRRRRASVLTKMLILPLKVGDGRIFSISTDGTTPFSLTTQNRMVDLATVTDASAITNFSTMRLAIGTLHASQGQFKIIGVDTTYENPDKNLAGTGNLYTKLLVQIQNT